MNRESLKCLKRKKGQALLMYCWQTVSSESVLLTSVRCVAMLRCWWLVTSDWCSPGCQRPLALPHQAGTGAAGCCTITATHWRAETGLGGPDVRTVRPALREGKDRGCNYSSVTSCSHSCSDWSLPSHREAAGHSQSSDLTSSPPGTATQETLRAALHVSR